MVILEFGSELSLRLVLSTRGSFDLAIDSGAWLGLLLGNRDCLGLPLGFGT